MDLGRARYVVSAAGRATRAALPRGLPATDAVALATELRRLLPAFEAAAQAEQLWLEARAVERFGRSPLAFYSGDGLEMLSHPLIAARRAERLAQLDVVLADLTCGIGGDLAALAATGQRTVGSDRDRIAVTLAAANVPRACVVRADAARPPVDLERAAIVIDPARREGSHRIFDPERFSPPWGTVMGLAGRALAAAVKTAPGIDHAAIPAGVEAEFVQVGRVLREATLWIGAGARPGVRRAVHLPSGATLDSAMMEVHGIAPSVEAFVLDPESCVTRAGLVRQLAALAGARLLDERVAYLTCDVAPPATPLAAAFRVLEVLPFSLARLRARLRQAGWRPVEIRRRAFPIEPDSLRRQLGGIDGAPVTLLCTTLGGRRVVIVGQPIAANAQGNRQ